MFQSLSRAFAQSFDPAFRSVFWKSLGAALGTFIVLWILSWLGLSWLGDHLSAWLATQDIGAFWRTALEWLASAGGFVAVLVTSFFLFPAVMVMIMSMLLDDIAEAVEQRYYPSAPPARPQPWSEIIISGLQLVAITLVLNLLLLPVYLALSFVPPLNAFVFYLLNGYLLGREYFELVAMRQADLPEVKQWRRRFRGRIYLAGIIIAVLLTIPLLNLITPIIATAFRVHVFMRCQGRATG